MFQGEPSYLLSSRSYWYPQNTVTEYATATLRITVPPGYAAVGSGEPAGAASEVTLRDLLTVPSGKAFVFRAIEPLRYLAFVVSRFTRVAETTLGVPEVEGHPSPRADTRHDDAGHRGEPAAPRPGPRHDRRRPRTSCGSMRRSSATRRTRRRRWRSSRATCRAATVPATSPSSTARCPRRTLTWRNDPAAFTGFPDFFLAHELAHQWWGQAVGWKNYHEQWISEGFAQYFAALYAQKTRGDETFVNMLRQFRRWSLTESEEGPVHLGYRLGPHQGGQPHLPRAGLQQGRGGAPHAAAAGSATRSSSTALRRFYDQQKFRKAGTDDLRRAFEEESGKSLERYFERWIYNSELPLLRYSTSVEGAGRRRPLRAAHGRPVRRAGHRHGDLRRTGETQEVVVPVTDKQVEHRFRAEAPVRQVQVNRDQAALAQFEES